MAKPKPRGAKRHRARRVPTPIPEVFHEDSVDREFFPEADMFQPQVGRAEARAAVVVQQTVLAALLEDPRVIALFGRWRQQLAAVPPKLKSADVLPLVRDELGLPWPWCVMRLLEAFHRTVLGAEALPPDAPEIVVHAPALRIEFETREGESTDQAARRLTELYVAALDALVKEERAVSGGWSPRGPDEHLRAWGRWFYEHRIAQPARPINAIARAHGLDRRSVREAIQTAERLLALGSAFRPPGD